MNEAPFVPEVTDSLDTSYFVDAARDDKDYMYVGCWKFTGEDEKPILLKEPLEYEAIKVQTRNYKS